MGMEDRAFQASMHKGLLDKRLDVFLRKKAHNTMLPVVSLRADLHDLVTNLDIHEATVFFEEFPGNPWFFFSWKMIGNGLEVEFTIKNLFVGALEIFLNGLGILEGALDIKILREFVGELFGS